MRKGILKVRFHQTVILSETGPPRVSASAGWRAKDLGFVWLKYILPLAAEVVPFRIGRYDQRNFLRSSPTLNLLFALYGIVDARKFFEVDQTVDSITAGETGKHFVLVLPGTSNDGAGHARVERFARNVSEDVSAVSLHGNTQILRSGFPSWRMGLGALPRSG